jgi:hypothetical protein
MIWVNLDKPTKKLTIHTNLSCIYVLNKKETPNKGIGKLKRDGGWISFTSIEEAQNYCNGIKSKKGFIVTTCCLY